MTGKQKVYDEAMAMAANYTWDQDWPNAIKSYRAALEEFPQDAAALSGLGMAYFELSQYESAVRALQRALQIDSSNQEALEKMGEALERLKRVDDAANIYLYSGNILAKDGQLDKAIAAWGQAIKVKPTLVKARNNLAQAYSRSGQQEEAIIELIALASIYQDQGETNRAIQYLQGALKLKPDNEYAVASLRALKNGSPIRAVQEEMKRSAQEEVQVLVEDKPEEEDIFFSVDEEDQTTEGSPRDLAFQKAMEELANVLFENESPTDDQLLISKLELGILINKAIDLQTRGRSSEAIEIYEQAISNGFNRASIHFVVACLYLEQNQYDRAANYLEPAKQNSAYLLGANFALGEIHKAQGRVEQSLRYFVEVLKTIDMDNANRTSTKELEQLYAALLDNYISQGNDAQTIAFVESLIKFLSSKDWEQKIVRARQSLGVDDGSGVSAWIEFLEAGQAEVILTSMANVTDYIRQNMLLTAAEACYWAIQNAPNYLPLHLRLAEIYLKQDRVDTGIAKYLAVADVYQIRENIPQVIAIYQKILDFAPMDVTVRQKLIEFNTSQGNFDAAIEHYSTLADAYYQLAQVNKALDTYREALQLAPKTTTPKTWQVKTLYNIGDIYDQRVDWRNATQIYEHIIKIEPQDNRALNQLVDLYFKLNQTDQAINILDRLMVLYNKQQQQKKALEVLQALVELRPQILPLRKKLAAFYVNLGLKQQALNHYNTIGEMQLDLGLPDDAAHTIETILQLGPDEPDNYRRLLAQIRGGI